MEVDLWVMDCIHSFASHCSAELAVVFVHHVFNFELNNVAISKFWDQLSNPRIVNLRCVVWFLYNIDLQDMLRRCLYSLHSLHHYVTVIM